MQARFSIGALFGRGDASFDKVLSKIGSPHKRLRVAIVTGSVGKSSVASMLARVISESGFKVGLFLSPKIDDPRGRIFSSFVAMDQLRFEAAHKKVTAIQSTLSEEDLDVICALDLFAQDSCEWAVLECGLDSQAWCLDPKVLVVTPLEASRAGTISDLARLACRFIHPGCPLITGAGGEAKRILWTDAVEKKSMMISGEPYDYEVKMLGEHQRHNAGLAYEAARALEIPNELIRDGIKSADAPFCIERVGKNIFLDCADALSRAKALGDFIASCGHPSGVVISFRDSAKTRLVSEALPPCMGIWVVFGEDQSLLDLTHQSKLSFVQHQKDAISLARDSAQSEDYLFVVGDRDFLRDTKTLFGS